MQIKYSAQHIKSLFYKKYSEEVHSTCPISHKIDAKCTVAHSNTEHGMT